MPSAQVSKLTDQVLSSETVQSARFVHTLPVFLALCSPRCLLPEQLEEWCCRADEDD